ncbi:MAG: NADH-quinone oxidoreductase subunit A [Buchnera aphidicola (Eriosoma harunire)]
MTGNTSDMNQSFSEIYLPFIIFCMLSLVVCIVMLFFGWVLGGKSRGQYKNVPFESGILSCGGSHLRFSIKFYLIAMFFVIFDVEIAYLYGWISTIYETQWIGFYEIVVFIIELMLGLLYLIRLNGLNWISED